MRCYLLVDYKCSGKLYVAFGDDCVDAAKRLIESIGGDPDTERFSVGGSWNAVPGEVIEASKWWPYFTCNPPNELTNPSAIDVVRRMK